MQRQVRLKNSRIPGLHLIESLKEWVAKFKKHWIVTVGSGVCKLSHCLLVSGIRPEKVHEQRQYCVGPSFGERDHKNVILTGFKRIQTFQGAAPNILGRHHNTPEVQ
mmetsp:Transcript_4258/g.10268  ORF Transcript_4258/g.10268 Transcript_4258/m.10268 type:complete len:107 (-) Transcript_4258:303-623(-)